MHPGAECIGENGSLAAAAQKMRDLGVGSLPICGADDRLHGILTDRDIVVRCIAEGRDPAQLRAGDLAQGTVFWSRPPPASARRCTRCRTTGSSTCR